jgi:hypothetical protein
LAGSVLAVRDMLTGVATGMLRDHLRDNIHKLI